MRLYLKKKDKNGKPEFLDVSIWSFIKCTILSSLLITVIVYAFFGIVMLVFLAVGLSVGWTYPGLN